MCDVFISYSSKDIDTAEMIRQILESNKIPCWIAPRNIPGGSNYAQEIPVAIRNCRVFLLILSSNAQSSIWVRRELDRAVNCQKTIIPFMIEDFPIGDVFDFYLTGYQRYEAFEKTTEAIQQLIQRIQAILGTDTASKGSSTQIPSASVIQSSAKNRITSKKETVPLRYDGLYYTAETCGFRTYYRFYSEGKVVSAYTSATPAQVQKWLNLEKYDGGSFTYDGQTLEVIVPLSDGHVYRATATVSDNKLILSGFNTFSQKAYDVECDFLPLDPIL